MTSSPDVAPRQPVSGHRRTRSLSGRYPALDGLRGVAALVVLVFHVLVVSPVYTGETGTAGASDLSWWLIHTPLALVWSGPEAVFVFFVLSGFVLALPTTYGSATPWRSYYVRRLARLYLPAWGSLVLALLLLTLVPPVPVEGASEWYHDHVPLQSLEQTARDALLLLQVGWLNSPLWSLRWELLFSLLLPLYLLGVRLLPRHGALKLAGLTAGIAVAQAVHLMTAFYLIMFAFGVLLAGERHRMAGVADRLNGRSRGVWWTLAAACVLLLTADKMVFGIQEPPPLAAGLTSAGQLLGATVLIFLALYWEPLVVMLSSTPVRWLGVHSFSLYLTHEPLVVTSTVLLPDLSVGLRLLVVLVPALLVARGFFLLVEQPSQRLSRKAGQLATGCPGAQRSGQEGQAQGRAR